MKSLREKFEEDYRAVPYLKKTDNKVKIRYIYEAPWYYWNLPEKELAKKKVIVVILSMMELVLFILSALLKTGLNLWFATAIAGLFSLAFHIVELFAEMRFLFLKYETTKMDYNYVNDSMRIFPWLHGISLLGAFILGMVYQIFISNEWKGFVVIFCYFVCATISFYIAFTYRKIPMGTKKNEVKMG